MAPMMAIETVAAGGGSVCGFDGTRLTVGPESAGSHPGPACYGNGGPLAVTDINLILGRIRQETFPFPLSLTDSKRRLEELTKQVANAGMPLSPTEISCGLLKIANHNMAQAVRTVSVSKGYDPREYPLVSFGGAAGQHCCAVADVLEIEKVLVHPHSSMLSALGIRLSDNALERVMPVGELLDDKCLSKVIEWHDRTISQLSVELDVEDGSSDQLSESLILELRYRGTESSIHVRNSESNLESEFQRIHKQLYGYLQPERPIEVVSARSSVSKKGERLPRSSFGQVAGKLVPQQFQDVSGVAYGVFDWNVLKPGETIDSPSMVGDSTTTTVIDSGWSATVLAERQLLLERKNENRSLTYSDSDAVANPVLVEIFNNSFRSIADQMGNTLRNTATSVNVKERLDYSCALFCKDGNLVANAPHIPVHLGAMSDSIRSTIRLNPQIEDGDVYVTNDPYNGGSHLPDITVITPVFMDDEDGPALWVASRAHHAEIGGMSPGSMPTSATQLAQEGVLIRNFKLLAQGEERFDELESVLRNAKYPSRNPAENISDIQAQISANRAGIRALKELVRRNGWIRTKSYMHHVREAAAKKVRMSLASLKDRDFHFEDCMDDGTIIKVCLKKRAENMSVDFSGSSPVHSGNLNANLSIVRSAITYVMRCLLAQDIPLNEGILDPLDIVVPKSFLNPEFDGIGLAPAVVGGNVETSQRIVDTLLGALGLAAASQGTMNNWLIGDETFGYYETLGGGSGATADSNGAHAVHCHMSNTRLTDPEILESRLPVVLREFRIRNNSGGAGMWQGGNGMIRSIQFLQPVTLSLLTSRRSIAPFGLQGGGSGQRGENWLVSHAGRERLPSQCERNVIAGDLLIIKTPGGGGFGQPNSNSNLPDEG